MWSCQHIHCQFVTVVYSWSAQIMRKPFVSSPCWALLFIMNFGAIAEELGLDSEPGPEPFVSDSLNSEFIGSISCDSLDTDINADSCVFGEESDAIVALVQHQFHRLWLFTRLLLWMQVFIRKSNICSRNYDGQTKWWKLWSNNLLRNVPMMILS